MMADEEAAIHTALAHPTRVLLMRMLRTDGTVRIIHLCERLAYSGVPTDMTTVLYHLRKLRAVGLVEIEQCDGYQAARIARDLDVKFSFSDT